MTATFSKKDEKLGTWYFFTASNDVSVNQFNIDTHQKVHHYK